MHVHVSGMDTLITFVKVVLLLGLANLIAMRFQDRSKFAAAWANLYGVS